MSGYEFKQRRKTNSQSKHNEVSGSSKKVHGKDGGKEAISDANESNASPAAELISSAFKLDFKTCICVFSLMLCLGLWWFLLQQNGRFHEVEKKYKLLYRKIGDFQNLREELMVVTEKLEAANDRLQGALSAATLVDELVQEVSILSIAITAEQEAEGLLALDIQAVKRRCLNATETQKGSLEHARGDAGALRVELQSSYSRAAERVNEVDVRLRALAEKLEELEESTGRNARALERSEEQDVLHIRDQVQRDAQQLLQLAGQRRTLMRHDVELRATLEERAAREWQCDDQLVAVEQALHNIVHLSVELGTSQRKVQDLRAQMLQLEQSLATGCSETAEARRALREMGWDSGDQTVGTSVAIDQEVDLLPTRRSEAGDQAPPSVQQKLEDDNLVQFDETPRLEF